MPQPSVVFKAFHEAQLEIHSHEGMGQFCPIKSPLQPGAEIWQQAEA
jgi:hypothetical protein